MKVKKSRVSAQIRWLLERGYRFAPLDEDVVEVVARRIGKNLHAAEQKLLRQQLMAHLCYGELSVEVEMKAALLNYELGCQGLKLKRRERLSKD